MAYDYADGYVVLFGGWNSVSMLGDTWKFEGGAWSELTPQVSPPARQYASMVYDARDGYVLLFGGGNGGNSTLSDTWSFKGGTWQELFLSTSPPSRQDAAMAYAPSDGYVVLFGGSGAAGVFGDTWKYGGGNWVELMPPASPAPRRGTGLAYDEQASDLVLFGGYDLLGGFGDTWLFKQGTWQPGFPAPSPSLRGAFGFTNDSADGYVLLVGGYLFPSDTYAADPWGFGDPLGVALSANPSIVYIGQSVTFTARANGGAPPYVYYWSGLPPGCGMPYTPNVTCNAMTTGAFAVSVTVNDTAWIVSTSTLSISVTTEPVIPLWLGAAGAVAVGLTAVAVALWWSRKHRRGPPEDR